MSKTKTDGNLDSNQNELSLQQVDEAGESDHTEKRMRSTFVQSDDMNATKVVKDQTEREQREDHMNSVDIHEVSVSQEPKQRQSKDIKKKKKSIPIMSR